MPHPGLVFKLTAEGIHHYWVVISPVVNGRVLAVNITDFDHCKDSTCVFDAGEHPIITKKSVAFYRKAREFDANKIDEFLATGQYLRRLEDFPSQLLGRLVDGAKKADDLTVRFLEYLTPADVDGHPDCPASDDLPA